MYLKQKSPPPPASSARSSSLVKIFWNLRSNFCLCGWSILLWFVLTTVTLNLRNKMMAMVPLTVFSWIQSQIGDEWDEKALGWPSLWTSQKLFTHSRGCPQKPRREKILSWHLCSSGFLSFYKWTFFLFPAGWGGVLGMRKLERITKFNLVLIWIYSKEIWIKSTHKVAKHIWWFCS